MNEAVNHPSHYNHAGRKECWDEWVDKFGIDAAISICLGSADKYLYRAGTKEGNAKEQDIAKAKAFFMKAESLISRNLPLPERLHHMFIVVEEELKAYDNN